MCQPRRPLSLISLKYTEPPVANLLVRGVDEAIVRALKERAGEHGQSAEAEHRAILAEVLTRPSRRTFAEVMASIRPGVEPTACAAPRARTRQADCRHRTRQLADCRDPKHCRLRGNGRDSAQPVRRRLSSRAAVPGQRSSKCGSEADERASTCRRIAAWIPALTVPAAWPSATAPARADRDCRGSCRPTRRPGPAHRAEGCHRRAAGAAHGARRRGGRCGAGPTEATSGRRHACTTGCTTGCTSGCTSARTTA